MIDIKVKISYVLNKCLEITLADCFIHACKLGSMDVAIHCYDNCMKVHLVSLRFKSAQNELISKYRTADVLDLHDYNNIMCKICNAWSRAVAKRKPVFSGIDL